MDVTRNAIGSYENGRALPTAKNMPKLASFLGVSVAYLQMETDYPLANEIPLPEDLLKIPMEKAILSVKRTPPRSFRTNGSTSALRPIISMNTQNTQRST